MMPKDRLKTMAEGIFFSLLTYGIQVYGGVWGLDTLNFTESRTRSFTKEDNYNIQVIMNKVTDRPAKGATDQTHTRKKWIPLSSAASSLQHPGHHLQGPAEASVHLKKSFPKH